MRALHHDQPPLAEVWPELGHLLTSTGDEVERSPADVLAEPSYRDLLADRPGLLGGHGRAIENYEALLADQPNQPKLWLAFGHALRATGRRDDAVAAYHRCIALSPCSGEAYWSLANLKTVSFSTGEKEAMRAQLVRTELRVEDRLHLHYALGKAREDAGKFGEAFEHYAAGAGLRRAQVGYDAPATTTRMRRAKALFHRSFFTRRAGAGSHSTAPVFVVGLPRSGSTLIEQILASHPAVEGVGELPELMDMARGLARDRDAGPGDYFEAVAALSGDERVALGERYVEAARIHRRRSRPFFVDKMPNNFHHIALIQLILPKAKIIDARRHPMAAGFSAFKQHFARGHGFSYDLGDIGRYYRDYVELMAHFDEVLPSGRIHRMLYEDLVEDTEREVRRLLDYCGLPFEAACLRFYENDRVVRTASSEQVRRPIFREGLDHWRRFEPWLAPLKDALGPSLRSWAIRRDRDPP